MQLALFDLDRTLIDGYAYARLVPLLWRAGVRRGGLLLLATRLIASRLTPGTPLSSWWPAAFCRYLAGLRPEEIEQPVQRAAELVRRALRPEMAREITLRRAAGDELWLVSATVEPLAAPVAASLGFDRCLATHVALREGRFTGELGGPVCRGAEKRRRVAAEANGLSQEVEWSKASYFADGYEDLPLLEAVGRPVAVRPDAALHAAATAQGWDVWGPPRRRRAGG